MLPASVQWNLPAGGLLTKRFIPEISNPMNHFFRFCVLVALAAVGASRASADLVLSTPSGLSAGDHFRFIFVTGSSSSTTGASSDITTYDTFVRNSVSSLYGNVTYGGSPITNWLAVGSTPTVNAKDHLGGYSSSVSVWLPDGTRVASSLDTAAGGLWSGTLANKINQYLDGSTRETAPLLTGSDNAGLAYTSMELGASGALVRAGLGGVSSSIWVNLVQVGKTQAFGMYAVSPELITQAAPAPVPEIDPASFGSVAAVLTGAFSLIEQRRRRRGNAIAATA
jgi:hypothetical protein